MATKVTITNHLPRVHAIADLCVLRPGANLVDADAWAKAKALPLVRHHVEAGDLSEGEGEIDSEASGTEIAADALAGLNVKKATELVASTTDVRALRAWAEVETRATVKKAIALQLETINAHEKADDAEDDANGEG